MKNYNSMIRRAFFGMALVLASSVFCFAQKELPALDFVGASDENPDRQSVTLQLRGDARVEVSDERLIQAKLRNEGGETSTLDVAVNTVGLEATEEGTEYEGKVVVLGESSFIIPIKIIVFPFVPRECRGKRVSVQTLSRGTVDNFVGLEATFPSPYLVSTGILQRQYDDLGTNKKLFGDSYALGGCRVCGIRVYVRARREGELDDNDTLSFGVSDAGNGATYNAVSVALPFAPMWTGQPSPSTFYREIPGSVINPELISKNAPMLDISSQDDTAIDYTRVYIYRY
jgi:hypothetical protein